MHHANARTTQRFLFLAVAAVQRCLHFRGGRSQGTDCRLNVAAVRVPLRQGELSVPSSLFLRDTSSFEEPETIEVEEGFIKADSQIFHDKLIFSNVHGSENHDWHSESSFEKQESEYKALPSTTDGDSYEHQLPYLYRKMAEVTEQMQSVSEYLANPITDRAPGYLPAGILSPATDTTDEHQELECSPLSVFPTTFLTPVFSYGGKLNLDTVRLNCSSFTR